VQIVIEQWRVEYKTPGHIPVSPFIRWDEKAGLQRDAIRSQ
jgi:hypothetical protein